MKWFKEVKTMEELRKQYRQLLKQYHPDNENGSDEIAKEINAEYDIVFTKLSHETTKNEQSYANEENEQFKMIIKEIIGFNITVQIIGSWVWCFDSYQYKDKLKNLGFKWCSRKKAWVWHAAPYSKYHKHEIPLSQIKAKYGCKTVKSQCNQYSIEV